MYLRLLYTSILLLFYLTSVAQPELQYAQNKSLTYEETIQAYTSLAEKHGEARLLEYGPTDVGRSLHLFVISGDKEFDADVLKKNNKRILLINNAIHPGEPCGVDASVQLAMDILSDKDGMRSLLRETVICIIPFYNIGGGLNRSCCSRVNQNGPEEYGFRGNAQNLDLNRDFIKCDSRNAREFVKIFQKWMPDVFVDTHTTDGYDYQYAMGIITTQRDKLHPTLSNYLYGDVVPSLFDAMNKGGHEVTQYVYARGKTPETGIKDYPDSPRLSTGYAAQFNCMGFITEAHKFKPFAQRVEYTHAFLLEILKWIDRDAKKIGEMRRAAMENDIIKNEFVLRWQEDTIRHDSVLFKGYTAKWKKSEVTGLDRLYYDTKAPFQKNIAYFNHYNPGLTIQKPATYVIPQAWSKLVYLLLLNGVKMNTLEQDTLLDVDVYYIENLETHTSPYEGHYLHYDVEVRTEKQLVEFRKGDFVVDLDQPANRFVIEALEPQATDSYFAWNFFDPILQRKEWFSDFAFEETAMEILKQDESLRKSLELKRKDDKEFAASHWRQLDFILKSSRYYEKSAFRYPVARIPIAR